MPVISAIGKAKVNLTLDILGKRDDGYHELATVMQSIALYDRLVIEPASDLSLELMLRSGVSKWLPNDDRNDVLRAARLLQKRFGITSGARIQLHKFIPTQAGLGGGSADAAAALLGLNQHWQIGLSQADLLPLAMELGSDTPFMLVGGTAICRGRGEIVQPVSAALRKHLVLFKPPGGLSTSRVFQRMELTQMGNCYTDRFIAVVDSKKDDPFDYMNNHLQDAAFKLLDELRIFADLLQQRGVRQWQMSGSGSTIFVVIDEKEQAQQLRRELTPPSWWSFVTRTVDCGAELVLS